MKKFYMILAAVAAMTLSAQAQVLEGTIEVGDFYNTTETYDGSYWDCAPTTYYLAHTGAQMLYTADNELGDLKDKANVNITKLCFRLQNNGAYEDIFRYVKIYMEATDATEFAVNDEGVKQFFTFDKLVYEGEEEFSMIDFFYEDNIMEYTLDEPFSLPAGKNLLVTMIYDAEDDDNGTDGTDMAPFYTSGIRSQVMTYTDNYEGFESYAMGNDFPDASATLGCGTNVELPVTIIQYTYGKATSVDEVKVATTESNVYYNLMGQKFVGNNLPAGIYIHDGQKVVVK